MAYLVVRFDVELDLLAGKGSYSRLMSAYVHASAFRSSYADVLDLHVDCGVAVSKGCRP